MEPILDIIDLSPGEIRSREHDWSDNVVSGTSISGQVDVIVTDLSTGVDVTSTHLVSKNQSGNITGFSLRRPTGDTVSHGVTFHMTRSDGDIFRDFYLLGREGTVYDLVASAFEHLNIVSVEEVLTSSQQRQGLRMLNSMLASWSDEPYRVSAAIAENFVLTIGDSNYTIGSGGDFNTVRPKDILTAFIRYGGLDSPNLIIGRETYDQALPFKNQAGPPMYLYFEPTFPLARIFLYPVPDLQYELWIRGQKELTAYTSLMAAHGLERDYEEAIKWNLAQLLSGTIGVPLPQAVGLAAAESLGKLEHLRSGHLPLTLDGGLLVV